MGARLSLGKTSYFGALGVLLLALVLIGSGKALPPTATVVVTNPSYDTLAVDGSGHAWGVPLGARTQLWTSTDEGATWSQVNGWNAIGKRVWYVTPLQSGALLVAYDSGTHWSLARSTDGGATWATVLALPCIVPDCTQRYTTLTAKSIVEGDGYVFLGTYSNSPASTNTNYVYRSADDGATWSIVNTSTNLRHIHGLAFNSGQHRLYVLSGDSAGQALWYSPDDGVTLQPLCTDYQCTGIEAIVSGSSLVFGTDNPSTANHIVKVDTTSGSYTDIATTSYPSYSAGTTGGIWLIAETHESGAPISDPQIHLWGSSDGGATWSVLYSFTIPSSAAYEMHADSVYPNGDVAILIYGQGTVVLRISSVVGGAPGNTAPPTITGTAQESHSLTASTGSWSNNPTSFAYQWRRCDSSGNACSDILGTNSSAYTLQAADVGSTMRVIVSATNAAGTSAATSNHTAVVTGLPPTNTTPPTIVGTTQQGSTLSATTGLWTGSPTFTYAWQRCSSGGSGCAAIGSATGTSYTLQASDVGSTLRVRVTATNGFGGVFADSSPTAVITTPQSGGGGGGSGGGGGGSGGAPAAPPLPDASAPPPAEKLAPAWVARPKIRGTLRVGRVLTTDAGRWTQNPSRFTYTWLRCGALGARCVKIGVSGRSYKLRRGDLHHAIRVLVTASNDGGSMNAVSAATRAVKK